MQRPKYKIWVENKSFESLPQMFCICSAKMRQKRINLHLCNVMILRKCRCILCYLLCKWQNCVFVRFLHGLPCFVVAPQRCESVLLITTVSCTTVVIFAAATCVLAAVCVACSHDTRQKTKIDNKIVRIIISFKN